MCIQSEMFPQGRVVHILINEGKTGIRISVIRLPGFITIPLSIETKNQTARMFCDQMGNIRIVKKYGAIELTGIQDILSR